MSTLKKRYAVGIVLLSVVTPLALLFQYNVPPPAELAVLSERIPKRIGSWYGGRDRPPNKKEVEILETEAILTRTYSCATRQGPDVDFSVVYSENNRRVAHPPQICYKGSGWNVEEQELIELDGLEVNGEPFRANRLLLTKGGTFLHVLYWFKGGTNYYADYLRMQWGIIWTQFRLRTSSSALLRVSIQTDGKDQDGLILDTLKQFTREAIPVVTEAIP